MKTLVLLSLVILSFIPLRVCSHRINEEDPFVLELRKQLYNKDQNIRGTLQYPQSVMRFYRLNDQTPVWLTPAGQNNAAQTMLLLDCVLMYGLAPKDYHPKELTYDLLESLSTKPDTLSLATKVRFEIMLTDAMISMINNLHFGKLNPDYSRDRIDAAMNMPFHGDAILAKAITGPDFQGSILDVQPHNRAYQHLQHWMHLWKGMYTGDCYEVPDSDVQKVAINMERLRWAEINDSVNYVQINIPSYELIFHLPDTGYSFKVVVGKPKTPTPVLSSKIAYFTTAPDWMVPQNIFINELLPKAIANPFYLEQNNFGIYDRNGLVGDIDRQFLLQIQKSPAGYYLKQSSGCDNALGNLVFRFQNLYNIYLHDTPEQQLFGKKERAFSHGCIRLENATKLAELLLKYDGSANRIPLLNKMSKKEQKQNFILQHPVPVKVTYLTCTISSGYLVHYPDIYHLDAALAAMLYNDEKLLTKN